MTLPQVYEQFDYWRKSPPVHELVAGYLGYEPPLTVEEQHAQGAMNDAEFVEYYKRTGGKVLGATPGMPKP